MGRWRRQVGSLGKASLQVDGQLRVAGAAPHARWRAVRQRHAASAAEGLAAGYAHLQQSRQASCLLGGEASPSGR